ncbi:zona pellucida sperm-binding protein 3-like [Synchiropus splendidus]|uniref:zona pellucida sperm-binding protein 3-like n=1 Tax=Synchiropus splendidus TaxID=270530 RepID=UPI00237D7422|nr:zona pellucida sperm-binding protein 3-like [Synchiropus splendidus]
MGPSFPPPMVTLRDLLPKSCSNQTKNEYSVSPDPHEQLEKMKFNSTQRWRDLNRFHSSYRLRKFQLRKQAEEPKTPEQKIVSLLEPAADDLEHREAAEKRHLVQGPNLNPPTTQQSKVPVKTLQPSLPAPANSTAVLCGEGTVTVEVKQNFFGNNQLIQPGDLTLGGCGVREASDQVLRFQSELQDCGSTAVMTDDALIYSFTLSYSPSPITGSFIFRTNSAQMLVQCHYQRRHFVSSDSIAPTWLPATSWLSSGQQLHFSLHLMTEDWQFQRPSNIYFLSDSMHVEASLLQGNHVPLRIYVDSCVATNSHDPNSQPRHVFISNHGCFSDTSQAGSKSYFLPRRREDKLQFQLRAFQFHQDHRTTLNITCHLKATTVAAPVDSQHKACSFLSEANRWVASGGDNKVCSCCESSCGGQRRRRRDAEDPGAVDSRGSRSQWWWEETASLGPSFVQRPPQPVAQQQKPQQSSAGQSVVLKNGVGAVVLLGFLVCTSAVVYRQLHKPPGQALT